MFSLVTSVSSAPAAAPVAQTTVDDAVGPMAMEPVDPEPGVLDASDLVKAVQLAEQAVARITTERAAAQERADEQARAADQARVAREQAEALQRAEAEVVAVDCDLDTSDLGRVRSHVRTAAEFLGCRYGEPDMHGVAGRAGTSDHPSGLAVDFMVDRATGDDLADCALNNQDALGVKYVIWEQRINFGDGDGWRRMEDRGDETANHFDHVHVSFDSARGDGDLESC